MKLSNLNGQIRNAESVKIAWDSPVGILAVTVQKSSLMAALKAACPDNKTDVPLHIRADGYLMRDAETQAEREAALAGRRVLDVDDMIDLLADGEPANEPVDLLADLLG